MSYWWTVGGICLALGGALALVAVLFLWLRDREAKRREQRAADRYCVRCGHMCTHTPAHRLLDDAPVCEDTDSCEERQRADLRAIFAADQRAAADYDQQGRRPA